VRVEAGLLLEEAVEDVEAVAQGAGDDDGVEPGELVGQEVQVGDAASGPEVAGVRPGVQGPHGDDEAEAVGAGEVTAAPGPGKRDQPADWDTIGDSPRLRGYQCG